MGAQLATLRLLERGAAVLRRLGLGSVVEWLAPRIAPAVGKFQIDVDGLRLHGDHIGQLYYVRELLQSGRERTFVDLLVAAIPSGGTVLEAGGHMGYVTLQAARAVGPSGRVVTFEPNPRTVPVIKRNLEANGLADRVTVVQLALGDAAGRHAFYLSGGGDTSSLHRPDGETELVNVEVTTVDEWLGVDTSVDVVKLDIEGAEVAALRGMERTLRAAAPGLVVFAECNPDMLERAGSSRDELLAILRDHDLRVTWIDEARSAVRSMDDADWSHGYLNLYCTREGDSELSGSNVRQSGRGLPSGG
jgi:FkbM family methyltransferase